MQITQDPAADNHIKHYENGQITIKETTYTKNLIVSPQVLIDSWPVNCFSDINSAHLDALFKQKPELVILGTGQQQEFPSPVILQYFAERQVGVEVMTTGAACRTFNILLAEGRQVVAGLILK